MNSYFNSSAFPFFLYYIIDFLLCFLHHLFNSGRMNSPVIYELLQRYFRYFSPDWIESRQNHCLRGIINNKVNPGKGLKSSDVSPFPPDDSSFHLIVRKRYHGYAGFSDMVSRVALDCGSNDFPCFSVCFFFSLCLDITYHYCGFVMKFVFNAL